MVIWRSHFPPNQVNTLYVENTFMNHYTPPVSSNPLNYFQNAINHFLPVAKKVRGVLGSSRVHQPMPILSRCWPSFPAQSRLNFMARVPSIGMNTYTRIRNDPSGWYLHQYTPSRRDDGTNPRIVEWGANWALPWCSGHPQRNRNSKCHNGDGGTAKERKAISLGGRRGRRSLFPAILEYILCSYNNQNRNGIDAIGIRRAQALVFCKEMYAIEYQDRFPIAETWMPEESKIKQRFSALKQKLAKYGHLEESSNVFHFASMRVSVFLFIRRIP